MFNVLINNALDLYDNLRKGNYKKRVTKEEYKTWLEERLKTNGLLAEELYDVLEYDFDDFDDEKGL